MSNSVVYNPQLIVDVEDASLLNKIRNAIKMIQGVGKVAVVRPAAPAKPESTAAADLYEVSPRLKALEVEAPDIPADLSYDYKREARAKKAAKYQ